MSDSLKRYIDTVPKVFRPAHNRVISALLQALAESDDEIQTQIQNAKGQNFVRTATGQNLDRLANSLGVSRPPTLGMSDTDYQNLIPNLSLKPKQIKKAFYDTADIFWGPLFSRANITSNNSGPFDVSAGDEFDVIIDGSGTQRIKVLTGDIASPGAATAAEIQVILSRIVGATTQILKDSLTGNERINIRTNTPGSVGTVEILGTSTMVGPTKLDFDIGPVDILDLPQRVSIYNIDADTLLIEIPSIVPVLRRTLKGSHHFHLDGTLEPEVPPANGIWVGSFFFNPSGSGGAFTVTSQTATLQQTINKGDVLTSLTVDDTSKIVNPSGVLMLNFGRMTQEVPIKYRGVPNANTILIDPSYVFKNDHASGQIINVISAQEPFTPNKDGSDYAIYLTSPSGAREVVQEILATLAAAGIIVKFLILAPKYKYLIDNPYLPDDDAPTS